MTRPPWLIRLGIGILFGLAAFFVAALAFVRCAP